MKRTIVLLLGATLCLAQDANNTTDSYPLFNKTDGNNTHHFPPGPHPLLVNKTEGNNTHHFPPHHPRPHHKLNETNVTAPAEATNTTDNSTARLLAKKKDAGHHLKEHKAPGKNLRGHHQKPAEANNVTKPAEANNATTSEPEENNETQVNEEESVVAEQAEQGEDAEEAAAAAARVLANKKVRKNKKAAPRKGHKKNGKGKHVKRHHDVGENAEGVIGGEDAEDIEHELRRFLNQVHQGNSIKKKQVHAKKPQWKKPAHVKPELKPEDFDFFGEHHIFGEDAFENGEGFDFGWNHHKKH